MQLTVEQEAVINTNHNLVINAVAGSGKTTTLINYAKSRRANSRILYLAFNKAVKIEALAKFVAAGLHHVKVETAHSLAFDHVIKHSNYNVVQGYSVYEFCELLQIDTGDRHTDFIIGGHVIRFISYFCNNAAGKVQQLDYREVVTDPKARVFVENFYSLIEKYTREALAKMNSGEIAVTHDFYLKKFQLSNPALPYDYILFDEGQDASAAMLDVFLKQPATKIIVGDTHQQIYGWRYAINSLQEVDFPVFNLSNSFRFGTKIALVANKILELKKQLQPTAIVKIKGVGTVTNSRFTKATIGRTNLGLLLNAISQWQQGKIRKVFFEGNINSYTFADEGASLYDVLSLYNGNRDKIKDSLIAGMNSMKDLEDYIEKTADNSLRMMVEVVEEFGNRLPGLIKELKTNHTAVKEDADMIFSTVHRCKGMEYDEVILLNDFINEEKLTKYIAQSDEEEMTAAEKNRLLEEINILYVAATRAKNKLTIPPDINPLQKPGSLQQNNKDKNKTKYQAVNPDYSNRYETKSALKQRDRTVVKGNSHGKSWNEQEKEKATLLYNNGCSLTDIAAQLGRGANAVKMKLINMGIIDDSEVF